MAALDEESGPPTRAGWADARLREAILGGELRPGDRLRAEHLAPSWGLSATPLREAFQRLAGEGLVVIEPQRGARVADIAVSDAVELYEMRLLLDPIALRSSMERADDGYREEVSAAYDALAARHRTAAAFLAAHRTFHLTLLSRCENGWLLRTVASLHDHTQRYHVVTQPNRTGSAGAEHRTLRDAVLAGDRTGAVRVLKAHLRATLAAVRTQSDLAETAPGGERTGG